MPCLPPRFWLLQGGYLVFSLAGVLLKAGARHPVFSAAFIPYYAGAFLCVFFFALVWQQVLRACELITAYAWRGTILLWTFLWASLFFGETVTLSNILGAILVVCGMMLVTTGE